MGLEIYQTWVLSTAHITKADDAVLRRVTHRQNKESEFIAYSFEYGYRIFIQEDDFEEAQGQWARSGLSDACRKLFNRAHKMGVRYVEFDCDGPVEEGLDTHEW